MKAVLPVVTEGGIGMMEFFQRCECDIWKVRFSKYSDGQVKGVSCPKCFMWFNPVPVKP
jgi:hypothetical protein